MNKSTKIPKQRGTKLHGQTIEYYISNNDTKLQTRLGSLFTIILNNKTQ